MTFPADALMARPEAHASPTWDVPQLCESSLLGIIVPPIVMPVKDCKYKGEYPKAKVSSGCVDAFDAAELTPTGAAEAFVPWFRV